MKRIGITQRLVESTTYFEVRDCLDTNWTHFVRMLNFIPVPIPSKINPEEFIEGMKLDSIILSGGNDLSTFTQSPLSLKRDQFETEIISFCIKKNIPIIGICRGMQLIGDFFKCTIEPAKNHVSLRHQLKIVPGTSLFKELSEKKTVNSYHNYGISRVSDEIEIYAYSFDGFIEAFRHKKHRIYCQMWHPERENPFNNSDLKIIKKILE